MGLGLSGDAAARLLLAEGTEVCVIDAAAGVQLEKRAEGLGKLGAKVVLSAADPASWGAARGGNYDVCIVSPGVRCDSDWMEWARDRGVPVLTELELGVSRCKSGVLAVTGSNGKSTLVKLCCEALRNSGTSAKLAGNCGIPVSTVAAARTSADWLVVEVSSFQLEQAGSFRPDVGVLLNVQPDHIDRHGSMEAYTTAKSRLFAGMGPEDIGIVPYELLEWAQDATRGRNTWRTFGSGEGADARYIDHHVNVSGGEGTRRVSVEGSQFDNEILGAAAAAAVLAVEACGGDGSVVGRTAASFEALPHRLEFVAEIGGIRFVDDSKATNLSALSAAIRICGPRVRLIAGGLLKEPDPGVVKEVLAKGVECAYLIGTASGRMKEAWWEAVPCRLCETLSEAVAAATEEAAAGDTVLLSPGCASFDQFANFEDRGNQFNRLVRAGLGE